MLARLIAVVLLLAAPLAAAGAPASPASLPPSAHRYVYAELDLAQPTFSTVEVAGELWIYRYDVKGRAYDADELQAAMQAPDGEAFIAAFERAVADAAIDTLGDAFPGATITATAATLDRASLAMPGGNRFDPPVHVRLASHVAQDRAVLGLGSYSDAAIAAALAAGAKLGVAFDLPAASGYHISYLLKAPSAATGIRFAQGPDVNGDGTALVASVDNTGGRTPTRAVSGTLVQPGARPASAEDIRSAVIVAMHAPSDAAGGIPVAVTVASEIRALDVQKRMPGMIPERLALPYVDANGLRALRQAGAIRDADVARANDALLATLRQQVGRTFGGQVNVTGGLSTIDLASPQTGAPIAFTADAGAMHKLPGAQADDVDLALRIGGSALLDIDFFAVFGRPTSYVVHAMPGTTFIDIDGGNVSTTGATANFQIPAGKESFPALLKLHGAGVPLFEEQVASVNVTVDLEDLDVSLGEAAGGDFGDLLIQIDIVGELNVIEVPAELAGSVPPALGLEHLSSDGVRMLIASGHVDEQDLASLESRIMESVARQLRAAFDVDVPVTGGIDRATLAASLASDPVSSRTPIRFEAGARLVKPLAGAQPQTQAAIALYTQEMPLTLTRIEGIATTYTIIMPRGLSIEDVEGSPSRVSKSADGRDQLTVTPQGDTADVTVSMGVTPTFVLAKFWPALLLAFILVVLVVGTPIAFVVRRRGKAKKAAAAAKKE